MKNIAIAAGAIVIAVVGVLLQRVFFSTEVAPVEPQAVPVQLSSPSLTGEVISVEKSAPDQRDSLPRRATIKLSSGETVQASVHAACVVLPGQVARLAKVSEGAEPAYWVQGTE
jgi:hypothetical protein